MKFYVVLRHIIIMCGTGTLDLAFVYLTILKTISRPYERLRQSISSLCVGQAKEVGGLTARLRSRNCGFAHASPMTRKTVLSLLNSVAFPFPNSVTLIRELATLDSTREGIVEVWIV
jgi:hypothetical protein